jgi:tRNA-specific 2-thiouridylase
VVEKDVESNRLVVAQGNHHPALFSSILYCHDIAWIDGHGPDFPANVSAKTRYRQPDQDCRVEYLDNIYRVTFKDPQRAVTPGQWACFYDGEICLGGGIIERTEVK